MPPVKALAALGDWRPKVGRTREAATHRVVAGLRNEIDPCGDRWRYGGSRRQLNGPAKERVAVPRYRRMVAMAIWTVVCRGHPSARVRRGRSEARRRACQSRDNRKDGDEIA